MHEVCVDNIISDNIAAVSVLQNACMRVCAGVHVHMSTVGKRRRMHVPCTNLSMLIFGHL